MELKVLCNCGQKYKFDVEPVNGAMPYAISCPVCGIDGTPEANTQLAQIRSTPPPLPAQAPLVNRLAISQPAASPVPSTPLPLRPAMLPNISGPAVKPSGQFNLGLGIAGALAGALVGAGLMYAIFVWGGFRFPLLGVGIGFLTGYGARLLGKGSDQTLGIISAVIALGSVVGALYLMYGDFPVINIISVAVSASVAYKTASR